MDLYTLKRGDHVSVEGGIVAEVLEETQDGKWILVRYLTSETSPDIVNSEDLCSGDEIEAKLTA